MDRFAIMDRRWAGSHIQLIIMDWKKARILTLALNELKSSEIDPELAAFIERKRSLLESTHWKSDDVKP